MEVQTPHIDQMEVQTIRCFNNEDVIVIVIVRPSVVRAWTWRNGETDRHGRVECGNVGVLEIGRQTVGEGGLDRRTQLA